MLTIRNIKEEEMIGEFLKAELHSSRFREGSLKALSMLGYDENLIENPDYTASNQNQKRANVLGLCRGWPDKELFTNFPSDIAWTLATITQDELARAYRLKSSVLMTDEERLLSATAERISRGEHVLNVDSALIKQISGKIKQQQTLPPIILVSESMNAKKVLLEGHSRSIAYYFVDKAYVGDIPTIVGLSPNITQWAYY